jgi:hypothetical protein
LGSFRARRDAFDVAVRGGIAYVAFGRNSGLRIIDVTDPANPVQIGSRRSDGLAIGVAVAGRFAYLADDIVRVIDVANVASPSQAGSFATAGDALDVAVADYVFAADGQGGLVVLLNTSASPGTRFLPLVPASN